MSDLSQSEREAMEAAWQQERWLSDTSKDLRTFEAGWRARGEWSRSPDAVERDEAVAIVRELLVVLGDHSGDFTGWLQRLRDLKDRAQALNATSEKEGRDG